MVKFNDGKVYHVIIMHNSWEHINRNWWNIENFLLKWVTNAGFHNMTIGERSSFLIKEQNKTQTSFSREAGISKNAISNYVNNNRVPDTMICLKLARVLNVSMEWLLTGEGKFKRKYLSRQRAGSKAFYWWENPLKQLSGYGWRGKGKNSKACSPPSFHG